MAPAEGQRKSRRISSHKEYRAESATSSKRMAVERLDRMPADGTVMSFLGIVYTIAALGCIIPIPVLKMPMAPADAGFLENYTFWFGYDIIGCTLCACQSWSRLLKICHREGNEDFPPLDISGAVGCNFKSFLAFICYEVILFAVSGSVGYFNGVHAGEWYNMLYFCPIIGTLGDVVVMILLPSQEWSVGSALFLATQAALWGLPIFVLFVPIMLKIVLSPMQAAIIPVLIFPLLSEFIQKAVSAAVIQQMVTMGYDTPWFETGVTVHLDAMLSIGEMMLFPGADSPVILGTIIAVEALQRIMDNRSLGSAIAVGGKDSSSYAPLANTGESTTVKKSLGMALCCSSAEQREFGKQQVKEKNAEAFEELQQKGVTLLTALSAPVIFMVLSFTITVAGNRDKYYMYECLNIENEMVAIEFAGIALATQYGFLVMDVLFLYSQGLGEAFVMIFQTFVADNWLMVIPTVVFPCTLFTSCFLIKHDGIAVLQELLHHCPHPAEGSPYYKAAAAKDS